jgi:hypothetical protein
LAAPVTPTFAPTPAAAAEMAVLTIAAEKDDTIEERVEAERRDQDGRDLLRANAQVE